MTSNRIPILAADIRRAHGAAENAEKESAKCASEAGQALIEAKSLVKHGEWLPFLKVAGIPERAASGTWPWRTAGSNATLCRIWAGYVVRCGFCRSGGCRAIQRP